MFNAHYFPAFYFAPRYFPEVGAGTVTPTPTGYLPLLVTGQGYVVLQI